MPRWGRPSDARQARRAQREWEKEQQRRHWEEEQRRFEELDSDDDDDGQGVGLDFTTQGGRLASDELRFTGIDMTSRTRRLEIDDGVSNEEEGSSEEEERIRQRAMQVALHRKEDQLVQSALERIRRAQALGRRDVNLTESELDAIERQTANAASNSERQIENRSRRNPDRLSAVPQSNTARPRSRQYRPRLSGEDVGASSSSAGSSPYPSGASGRSPPGIISRDPNTGYTTHVPLYARPSSSSSRSAPRIRYSSVPEGGVSEARSTSGPTGPLPHEANWSRPRSSSSALPYPVHPHQPVYGTVDPFQYQVPSSPTIPSTSSSPGAVRQQQQAALPASLRPGYSPGRRNVSGPAEVPYSVHRKPIARSDRADVENMPIASSSEPVLARSRSKTGSRRRVVLRVESETETDQTSEESEEDSGGAHVSNNDSDDDDDDDTEGEPEPVVSKGKGRGVAVPGEFSERGSSTRTSGREPVRRSRRRRR